jgi:hypothetical protein
VYPRDGRKVQFSPASVARCAGTARAADVIFSGKSGKETASIGNICEKEKFFFSSLSINLHLGG